MDYVTGRKVYASHLYQHGNVQMITYTTTYMIDSSASFAVRLSEINSKTSPIIDIIPDFYS